MGGGALRLVRLYLLFGNVRMENACQRVEVVAGRLEQKQSRREKKLLAYHPVQQYKYKVETAQE